jgi:hypothetical protein
MASAAVLTRIRGALIDVGFTLITSYSRRTETRIVVEARTAEPAVEARIRSTRIEDILTIRSFIASRTHASKRISTDHTGGRVLTGVRSTRKYITQSVHITEWTNTDERRRTRDAGSSVLTGLGKTGIDHLLTVCSSVTIFAYTEVVSPLINAR